MTDEERKKALDAIANRDYTGLTFEQMKTRIIDADFDVVDRDKTIGEMRALGKYKQSRIDDLEKRIGSLLADNAQAEVDLKAKDAENDRLRRTFRTMDDKIVRLENESTARGVVVKAQAASLYELSLIHI